MGIITDEFGSKRLDLLRSSVLFNVIMLTGGIFMLAMTYMSISYNYNILKDIFEGSRIIRENGQIELWGTYSLEQITYAIGLIFFIIVIITWIIGFGKYYFGEFWHSLVEIFNPAKPGKFPGEFDNYTELQQALKERSVKTYTPIKDRSQNLDLRKAGEFLSVIFGQNIRFISPFIGEKIILPNGASLRRRVLRLLVFGGLYALLIWFIKWLPSENAGFLLSEPLAQALVKSLLKETTQQILLTPFLWLIAINLVLGIAELFTTIRLIPKGEPLTEAAEAQEYYRGFGHPIQLLNRLPKNARSLEWEGFHNRERIIPIKANTSLGVSDSATFIGGLFIEQQPKPIPFAYKSVTYSLLIVGWLLRLVALYILLFQVLPLLSFRPAAGILQADIFFWDISYLLVMLLTVRMAQHSGVRLIEQAQLLFGSFRFRSNAIYIEVEGDLARSDVKVGKSISDSLESDNLAVRSDFVCRFWAAELLSETSSLKEMRDLLAFEPTVESQKWIDFFCNTISNLREEGVQPLGLDFPSKESSQLTQANIAISALKAQAAGSAGKLEDGKSTEEYLRLSGMAESAERIELQALTSSENDSGEWKECPSCAEKVRARARKCRFCGYMFEEVESSGARK